MQTMQQQRAKFALDEVRKHANDHKVNQGEYLSHAAAMPAMIHMNGLGQAAALYNAKGGTHGRLYRLLSAWLTRPGQPYAGDKDLMDAIVAGDMHAYRLAQAEAQALMDWVVKFAPTLMTKPKTSRDAHKPQPEDRP